MTNSVIKTLAQVSFNKNKINSQKVAAIAEKLTRRQLKEYIKQLKLIEAKKNVVVEIAKVDSDSEKSFQKMFPENNVIIKENPQLMLGLRITKNYTVYKFNLKDKLTEMINYIEND